jgi:hypothetical protein
VELKVRKLEKTTPKASSDIAPKLAVKQSGPVAKQPPLSDNAINRAGHRVRKIQRVEGAR